MYRQNAFKGISRFDFDTEARERARKHRLSADRAVEVIDRLFNDCRQREALRQRIVDGDEEIVDAIAILELGDLDVETVREALLLQWQAWEARRRIVDVVWDDALLEVCLTRVLTDPRFTAEVVNFREVYNHRVDFLAFLKNYK